MFLKTINKIIMHVKYAYNTAIIKKTIVLFLKKSFDGASMTDWIW